MVQTILEFGQKTEYLEDDFIVTSSNYNAFKYIKNWPDWSLLSPGNRFKNCFLLKGDRKSGKTHLASIWMEKSYALYLQPEELKSSEVMDFGIKRNAFLIDDLERFLDYEDKIFSLINFVVEQNKFLMITAQSHPNQIEIKLPDLKSRLNALHYEQIDKLDDELCKAMLTKHFFDRQLRVSPEVIEYLIVRLARSYQVLFDVVERIDKKSLEHKRSITIPFVKEIIN